MPPTDLGPVEAANGLLQVHTPAGALPLYRFSALQTALLTGERVPFAAQWPEHMKLFLYRFVPLPILPPGPGSHALELGQQARDPGGLRPWTQSTFRGWPLYLYAGDQPGRRPAGTVPGLFEPVRADLPALTPAVDRAGAHEPPAHGP